MSRLLMTGPWPSKGLPLEGGAIDINAHVGIVVSLPFGRALELETTRHLERGIFYM